MNQNNNSSSLIMDSVYDNTNNNTNNQYGSMNTQLNYNTDMYNNPSNNVSDQTINYNDITPQAMNDLSNQNSSYVPISESQVVDDGKPHMSGNIIKIVVAVIIIIALVLVFIFLVLPLMKNDKKEETPTPTPTVVTEERTLGDEDHGYITVSGVWNEESEDNKLIYKNESDEVITLDFSNSSSAISWVSSERSSFENMQLTRDTINGYNAYVIKGNVGELYKIVYIFEDMNGISHYISGEGLNEESNIFNVLNTYTLKK